MPKPGAQSLIILRPRGPFMVVYDVGDTESLRGAPALPPEVLNPFAADSGIPDETWVVGSRVEFTCRGTSVSSSRYGQPQEPRSGRRHTVASPRPACAGRLVREAGQLCRVDREARADKLVTASSPCLSCHAKGPRVAGAGGSDDDVDSGWGGREAAYQVCLLTDESVLTEPVLDHLQVDDRGCRSTAVVDDPEGLRISGEHLGRGSRRQC